MAVFPCDLHPHRYPDPQRSIYLTYVAGDTLQTNMLRLCPRDFNEELELVGEYLAVVDESSQMSTKCELCDEPKVCSLFAKVFDHKAEMVQYAADFCADDAEMVLGKLSFANGRPMRTR